jgi:hypothetical protein
MRRGEYRYIALPQEENRRITSVLPHREKKVKYSPHSHIPPGGEQWDTFPNIPSIRKHGNMYSIFPHFP